MNTVNAAAAIGKSDLYGRLEPGRPAEISLLRIEDGAVQLTDGRTVMTADKRLRAVGCFRAGRWFEAVHDRERRAEAAE